MHKMVFSLSCLLPFHPKIILEHRLTRGEKSYLTHGQLQASLKRHGIPGFKFTTVSFCKGEFARPINQCLDFYFSLWPG